jgi:hypothetical protein
LADTGVIAGMSEALFTSTGAWRRTVSLRLAPSRRRRSRSITPINEMIDAATLDTPRPPMGSGRGWSCPSPKTASRTRCASFSWVWAVAERPGDVQILSPVSSPIDGPVADLRRCHTARDGRPIGRRRAAERRFAITVRADGRGAAGADTTSDGSKGLKPGEAVSVNPLSGDFNAMAPAATRRTEVVGNKIYAFGHPLQPQAHSVPLMTQRPTHALLPSPTASMKIATTGDVIGTVSQDRATTIRPHAWRAPIHDPGEAVAVTDRGFRRTFSSSGGESTRFSPLFTLCRDSQHAQVMRRETSAASFDTGHDEREDHTDIRIQDLFTGDRGDERVGLGDGAPLTFLLGNDFEPIKIQGVDLTIESTEQPRTAMIERVWLDGVHAKAGRTVPLKVLMRTYRGDEVVRTVPIDIPANASGSLQVMVSDGSRLAQWERREVRQPTEPRNVPQMIHALNTARKNNRLYVRLLAADAGAVVSGEPLFAAASGSACSRPIGAGDSFRCRTPSQWDLPTGAVVDPARWRSPTRISPECATTDFQNLSRHVTVPPLLCRGPKPVYSKPPPRPISWRRVDRLSIDAAGGRPGAETTAPILVHGGRPDGSLYVGSGNEGKVFKIDASGRRRRF